MAYQQEGVASYLQEPFIMTFSDLLKEPSLQIPIYVLITILGVMFGSFLNVLIYRIPKKEEFVKTSSHCMKCNHKLAWYDNIPLFSWLSLGGKCRYCKEPISKQYPIVEAINGILWLVIFLLQGLTPTAILTAAMASGLLALSIIDWRTYEIANGWHVFFLILGAINLALDYQNWLTYVIGFFCVSIPLLLIYIISGGRAIGGGDVKLMAACGFLIGWQNALLALVVGCIVGSVIHILRMKITKEGHVLAMGPYLSIGILTAALFGAPIINWYLSLFLV